MNIHRLRQLVEDQPDDWMLNVWANIAADLLLLAAIVILVLLTRKTTVAQAIIEGS